MIEIHYFEKWEHAPNLQSRNRHDSAADCSISLKFGTEFDDVIADRPPYTKNLQGQIVKGQCHSVT